MPETKTFRTKETADLLLAYTGNAPLNADTYEAFLERWVARLGKGRRFGVVLVTEPSGRDHGERFVVRDGLQAEWLEPCLGANLVQE